MKIENVISIDKRETYEQALRNHLEDLTDEQKSAKVNDMLVIYTSDYGNAFAWVCGNDDITKVVGILETVKYYLLTLGVEYE